MKNRYSQLGLALLLAGLGLMPTAYLLLRSIPIIALGISLVVLGATSLVLGRTRAPEFIAGKGLLETVAKERLWKLNTRLRNQELC